MGVKMNSRIITKNHTADPEIGFLAASLGVKLFLPHTCQWGQILYAVKVKRYDSLILSELDKLLIIILEMTVAVLSM